MNSPILNDSIEESAHTFKFIGKFIENMHRKFIGNS